MSGCLVFGPALGDGATEVPELVPLQVVGLYYGPASGYWHIWVWGLVRLLISGSCCRGVMSAQDLLILSVSICGISLSVSEFWFGSFLSSLPPLVLACCHENWKLPVSLLKGLWLMADFAASIIKSNLLAPMCCPS